MSSDNSSRKRKSRSHSKRTKSNDDISLPDSDQEASPTTQKRTKTDLAENLTCPITLALPIDPVIAGDGRTYERAAIAKYIQQQITSHAPIRSPITNVEMSPELTPSHQAKSLIESLIDNGDIAGEMADAWKQKRKDQEKFQTLHTKAQQGSARAMRDVAQIYRFGKYGVLADHGMAQQWYAKASNAGDFKSMAVYAAKYLKGSRYDSYRCALLGAAAEYSDFASLQLGLWYAAGSHGLPQNNAQAIRLLHMALSGECKYQHTCSDYRSIGQAKLQELLGANNDTTDDNHDNDDSDNDQEDSFGLPEAPSFH